MQRRDFLKMAAATTLTALAPDHATAQTDTTTPPAQAPVARPNVLLIISDQHRAGLTKRSGYPLDTSPTRDKLADGGVAFDHAYCTTPLCAPSRISMLTGRWPDATRVRVNGNPQDAVYTKHLFQVAKELGYRTGLAGKNHTFMKPADFDFWRHYDLDTGWIPPNASAAYQEFEKWMQALHANVALEPTPFPVEMQYPYRIVSDAIEFMGASRNQPFMLEVSFSEPHDPEQVPKPYWDMFPPDKVPDRCAGTEALKQLGYRAQWEYGHQEAGSETEANWRRYKSNYLGMLRLIDDQLARLLDFMGKQKLLENTIVVFVADHGDYLMDYGLGRKGVGLPDCLTRIPMVWSGPGIRPSKAGASAHVSLADLFPTVCDILGAEIPHGVQGRSLWPLLQGKSYPEEEFRSIYATVGVGGLYYEEADKIPFRIADRSFSTLPAKDGFDELNKVTMSGLQKMVRMGDWKLIYDMMGYGQLYNLKADPGELKNLFGQPQVAARQMQLLQELLMWTIRTQDSLPTGPQGPKYRTKWPAAHNWYAPYRRVRTPGPFIP